MTDWKEWLTIFVYHGFLSVSLSSPPSFIWSRTSTVAIPGVWNATSVSKPPWGLNGSNFTSSERSSQTNQSKEAMLHLSQSMLSSSFLFLRVILIREQCVCVLVYLFSVCLGCLLQESKDLACLVACCILSSQHNALFSKCLLNKLMYESIIYNQINKWMLKMVNHSEEK